MTPIPWTRFASVDTHHDGAALTSSRPCPVCNGLEHRVLLTLSDFQFYSDSDDYPKQADVKTVICRQCYCVFMNPCYSAFGSQILFAEAGKSYGAMPNHVEAQITWLQSKGALKGKSVNLDVGCYEGDFLRLLPTDAKKIGVDIDRAAVERGQNRQIDHQITLVAGDFANFQLNGVDPDLITMIHVLEHLPDPVSVLRHLRELSKDSVYLFIEIPIIERGQTNDINGFFSVQHMTHFSQNTVAWCLAEAGWGIVDTEKVASYRALRILALPSRDEMGATQFQPCSGDVVAAYDSLRFWYESLISVELKIKEFPISSRIVFWGAGAHLEFLFQMTTIFTKFSSSTFALVDGDAAKRGKTWRGIPILDPNILAGIDWKETAVVVSSYGFQQEISDMLTTFGAPDGRVLKLYDEIQRY